MHVRSIGSMGTRAGGFSLIELMVGLTISLIGTFAMMQAFSLFEGQKRTTTSGSDAQQSGSYSMYELERQVRTGGSGIVQGKSAAYNIWACSMSGPDFVLGVLPAPFAAVTQKRAIPALIYSGGFDGAGKALPDIVSVVSGNPAARVFGAPISTIPAAIADSLVMTDSAFGMYPDEYVLASDSSGNCVAGKISAVADDVTKTVTFDPAFFPLIAPQTYLFDLGKAPVMSLFGINLAENELVNFDLLGRNGGGVTAIADGIVLLKAVYGVDDGTGGGTADDGVVDAWVGAETGGGWDALTLNDGSAASALKIGQIRAIRAAVVSRSQLPERATDYDGSTVTVTLFEDLADATLHYEVATDPEYRYKVYTTVIPLHNASIKKIF